ncbi:MAG: SusC/RagA family TonB-linked outer membrane protein, partial [Flavobacteriales bacterium]|nr:SusC/RagA family TonB-linked outer membrane protein [Flavobacteriales bacterium]
MKPTSNQCISVYWRLAKTGLSLMFFALLMGAAPNDGQAQQPDEQYATISKDSAKELGETPVRKYMQQVTLDANFVNAGILDVFARIESQTQFKFSYDNNDINKNLRFNIDAQGMTVSNVLSIIANQTSLSFKQMNNDIIVRFKKQKDEPREEAIEKTITGTITNVEGYTVPGVNVVLKGTAIGTVTDIDGKFELTVPDDADTLIVSYIGYVTQYIPINDRTTIDVVIEEDIQALEEFVKIGYQTVRKSDLTGAVSVIDTKKASAISTNSVVESLQGLAPGVTVRNGGRPGQMGTIEIRGIGSFRNAAPLYVIDGMYADPNATINPNDIESIQILKDGSAAAIYGSRAANGVVIITTKKGQEGPTKVNVNAKVGLQQLPKRWDVMNSREFAAMQRMQYENSGVTPPSSVSTDFDPSIDTDWQDEGFRPGHMQDYNVSLSGGSKNSSYMVSGSWFENSGVLIGNEFERASLRINSTSEKGMFFFGENLLLTHTTEEFPAEGNAFYDLPQMLPIIDVQNPDYVDPDLNPEGWGFGSPDAVTYAWNYPAINSLNKTYNTFAKIVGNAYAGLNFTDYLNYKFNVGVEASFDRSKNIRKDGIRSYAQSPVPNSVTDTRGQFTSILMEHTVNFDKKYGRHEINAVAGFTQQETNVNYTTGGRTDMLQFNDEY